MVLGKARQLRDAHFSREYSKPLEITELVNDLLIEAEEVAAGDFINKIPLTDFRLLQERTADGRCLLIDESGNLGLGLCSTQPGDLVAFIRNARVPFILREAQKGRYELVGEANIRGFMHGEIAEVGPVELREILIQ